MPLFLKRQIMRFTIFILTLSGSLILLSSCGKWAIPETNQLLDDIVIVERSTNGDYQLRFNKAARWEIYTGTAADKINWDKPFNVLNGDKLSISRSIAEPRLYFGIITPINKMLIATERQINLTGTPNFRDMGGVINKDGRMVKWGEIYRSSSLNHLEPSDHARLKNLDISRVCDFRNNVETSKRPNILPAEIEYFQYAIGGKEGAAYADLVRKVKEEKLRRTEIRDLFVDIMESFTDTAAADFKPLMDDLVNENVPLVFHCAGGKDRTGFMGAIILSALNVDRETIKKEYLLSNFYRQSYNRKRARLAKIAFYDNETIRYGLMVHDEYLDAVFTIIDDKFGGIDNYLKVKFDLDEEKRNFLIERYTSELPEIKKNLDKEVQQERKKMLKEEEKAEKELKKKKEN